MQDRLGPQRAAFLDWLVRHAGKPCLWAHKGPDIFDCSGLVTAGLRAIGVRRFDPNFTNTDKLWAELPETPTPHPGDLVFYGGLKPHDVEHVMVWWGDGRVYGACGATQRILTLQEALATGARVRFRKLRYRKDLRGFRRSPLDEGTV